ncbi:MAG: efflux RND transporter permease subunit [Cyclobacteriaceae bacterium]|nr:efflux RND transporter permease subunit [Cyclobacteriaceae bacterium]
MNLPRITIENYQFTIVLFFLLLIMGIYSFFTMPRTEDPPLQLPGASIIVVYPGANPADIEELIVTPIEEALNELDDIKKMESTIQHGLTHIAIEFTFGTDANDKYEEVLQQVNSIRNELPGDIHEMEFLRWRSSDVSIMQLALVSASNPYSHMEKVAEELKEEIEKIQGVLKVDVLAVPEQQVRINMDPEKMAQMNVSLNDINLAILSNNANIPGGNLVLGEMEYNIRTSGSYSDLDEIGNTVIKSHQGRIIYLENSAGIHFDYADNRYLARYNGKRAIFLSVQQKQDYNIYPVTSQIQEIIREHNVSHPSDLQLHVVFDQSKSVDQRIHSFLSNLISGIVLVGLLIFLSLGYRASLLVMLAIPFSILIGIGFVDLAGFGFQQITIAALVISLGLLVDNSIVIVENIERFITLGKDNRSAAILGTSQLGWPVTSATLTTILAFIPIIAMPDKAGKFIQSLPVTVIFTLTASLIIALTLTPYLSMLFLKKKREKADRIRIALNHFIEGPYRNALKFLLNRKGMVIILSLVMMAGAMALFRQVGVSFFPKAEKPQFMIRILAPEGSGIERVNRITRRIEGVLDTVDDIRHYASNIGHGNPRIYYNIFPKRYQKNFSEIYVELVDFDADRYDLLVADLRSLFYRIPGSSIELKEFEQGSPVEAPLAIKVIGNDLDMLKRIAKEVEIYVRQAEGTVNVNNPLSQEGTDIYVNINKDKASLVGVPIVEIDKAIRTSVAGQVVSSYRDRKGKEYDIVLRLPEGDKVQLKDFDRIYVPALTGKMIPVKQLAGIEFKKSPGLITHFNMDRNATVTADILKGYNLNEVAEQVDGKLKEFPWPDGFSYKFTGEIESREESFSGMERASLIALIAIFAVLVLQFRSFVQPLIIFSAIPLAAVGSVLALYMTGNTFSFTAFIGLISLIGIVVNNSIILVDYSNELMREGKTKYEAVTMASETRFTPIILTTFTTIGGLLPLTLRGGTMWAPMGWTIIGGLFVSTLLSLILVPVLYVLITSGSHK